MKAASKIRSRKTRLQPSAPVETTKTRLIESCLDHVWIHGYAASSIASIADAAKIPKGSVFYYFPTKDDVILAAIDEYVSRAKARRQRELLSPPQKHQSCTERLQAYFRGRMEARRPGRFQRGCLLGNLAAEIDGGRSPKIAAAVRAGLSAFEHDILCVLKEASEQGEIGRNLDLAGMAATLVNGWEGALLRMKLSRSPKPLEDFIAALASSRSAR
jgi:TetR/AcrR family transcriptional regulator, transcriptional repressor for nem operon